MFFRHRNSVLRWFYRTVMKVCEEASWENTETHKTVEESVENFTGRSEYVSVLLSTEN